MQQEMGNIIADRARENPGNVDPDGPVTIDHHVVRLELAMMRLANRNGGARHCFPGGFEQSQIPIETGGNPRSSGTMLLQLTDGSEHPIHVEKPLFGSLAVERGKPFPGGFERRYQVSRSGFRVLDQLAEGRGFDPPHKQEAVVEKIGLDGGDEQPRATDQLVARSAESLVLIPRQIVDPARMSTAE